METATRKRRLPATCLDLERLVDEPGSTGRGVVRTVQGFEDLVVGLEAAMIEAAESLEARRLGVVPDADFHEDALQQLRDEVMWDMILDGRSVSFELACALESLSSADDEGGLKGGGFDRVIEIYFDARDMVERLRRLDPPLPPRRGIGPDFMCPG